MDALFQVHLLEKGEVYEITMPDMGIRGILIGSIMTEFAGKSGISCQKTGYRSCRAPSLFIYLFICFYLFFLCLFKT